MPHSLPVNFRVVIGYAGPTTDDSVQGTCPWSVVRYVRRVSGPYTKRNHGGGQDEDTCPRPEPMAMCVWVCTVSLRLDRSAACRRWKASSIARDLFSRSLSLSSPLSKYYFGWKRVKPRLPTILKHAMREGGRCRGVSSGLRSKVSWLSCHLGDIQPSVLRTGPG